MPSRFVAPGRRRAGAGRRGPAGPADAFFGYAIEQLADFAGLGKPAG
jgi:hypothetical protein